MATWMRSKKKSQMLKKNIKKKIKFVVNKNSRTSIIFDFVMKYLSVRISIYFFDWRSVFVS